MTSEPAGSSGPDRSAAGEHELDRGSAQDEHQQNREDDGRDRAHGSSLADEPAALHAERIAGDRADPRSRIGDDARVRIGATIGDLHRSATATIDLWLSQLEQSEPAVLAVEKEGNRRFVRLRGEEKSVFTVWLLIGQHTLHHETFMMPSPIENHAEFYVHLLKRNHILRGVAFTIGAEDAIFLEGRTPLEGLDAEVLDGVLGTHFEAVEQYFRAAMRIGWRSLFRG
jgi:hypothetical protein